MPKMTTYERALQIYQILIGAAHNRQVLTYPIVAELIGVPKQGLANHLEHIMKYCQRKKLPPLTSLVVKKRLGRPGPGLTTVTELNSDRERVFNHNWYGMRPLTIQDLHQRE
jgi:alkylated DNA nucleotide flippase Atl1